MKIEHITTPFREIVFTTILIFAFCCVVSAQSDSNSCPKIKISAPDYVEERDGAFKVSASFDNEPGISSSKFDWIIVKDEEILRKYNEKIIEIDTNNIGRQNRVTILAESLDKNCQNPAMVKVIVLPNIGSPLILDEYTNLNWNDERPRLDYIAYEMQTREDSELFAWIYFSINTSGIQRQNRLVKLLNHLSAKGLKKDRITFLITEEDKERFCYQPIPNELSNTYFCDDCIVIRGEDLEKLVNIFQSKPITKNRKK